jgi:hypothetical protein
MADAIPIAALEHGPKPTIDTVQRVLAELIRALDGMDDVAVIEEDGTWPLIPERAEALRVDGNSVTVFPVQVGGAVVADGLVYLQSVVSVAVEENPEADSGESVRVESLAADVLAGILQVPARAQRAGSFEPDEGEPWAHLGMVNGVRVVMLNFTTDVPVRKK